MDERLDDLFHSFLRHLQGIKNASEHTLRNYLIDWEDAHLFLQENKQDTLDKADKKTFREYIYSLHARGYQKRTIARRLSTLRSFFLFLVREKKLHVSPLDDLETPKLPKKLPHSVTSAEIVRLIESPDVTSFLGCRDRCIFELFYSSGLRVSELAALDIDRLNLDNLSLHVRGKGKKERVLPLTQTAADWLKKYIMHSERELDGEDHIAAKDGKALFLNRFGTRLTTRSIDRLVAKYLRETGLAAKVTPHTIRHTIATHWLERGMDLKSIQSLLGHENLATTTIYTQVSSTLKKEVYQKAHPRAKKEKGREDGKPDSVPHASKLT